MTKLKTPPDICLASSCWSYRHDTRSAFYSFHPCNHVFVFYCRSIDNLGWFQENLFLWRIGNFANQSASHIFQDSNASYSAFYSSYQMQQHHKHVRDFYVLKMTSSCAISLSNSNILNTYKALVCLKTLYIHIGTI